MRNSMKMVASAVILSIMLMGCQGVGEKQTGGTLLGALGGALAGSQIGKGRGQLVGVAVGTLLGAFIGSEIGKSLDRADRVEIERSTQQSLEYNKDYQQTSWQNPNSGNQGSVRPTRTWRGGSNQYCREYQQIITVGGKTQQAYGQACRQPDGQWKIINQ